MQSALGSDPVLPVKVPPRPEQENTYEFDVHLQYTRTVTVKASSNDADREELWELAMAELDSLVYFNKSEATLDDYDCQDYDGEPVPNPAVEAWDQMYGDTHDEYGYPFDDVDDDDDDDGDDSEDYN